MKMISKGHYQTTITLGYNNNIVVDVVKIIGNPSESRWRLTFNETLVGNKKKNLIWLNIYYNQYDGVIGHIHSSNFSSRIYSGYENVKARDKAY